MERSGTERLLDQFAGGDEHKRKEREEREKREERKREKKERKREKKGRKKGKERRKKRKRKETEPGSCSGRTGSEWNCVTRGRCLPTSILFYA